MWRCLDVLKDFPGDPAAKNDGGDSGVECTKFKVVGEDERVKRVFEGKMKKSEKEVSHPKW